MTAQTPTKTYQPMLPSTSTKPPPQREEVKGYGKLWEILKLNFSLNTLLLVGALFQSLVVLVLPGRHYALAIALPGIALAVKVINTLLMAGNIKNNIYDQGIIHKRVTALIPDPETNEFKPSGQKIAVLLLGAKSSHPLGVFHSWFRETGTWLGKMNKQMEAGEVPGYYGATNHSRLDDKGCPELTQVYYFRSIDDIHAFAHSPLHREATAWWDRNVKSLRAVGINHEIYEADAGHWENIFANFQPTGIGATAFLKNKDSEKAVGGVVSDEWVRPIINAGGNALTRSSGRLGWEKTKYDLELEQMAKEKASQKAYADDAATTV